jgi:hypothetical protein
MMEAIRSSEMSVLTRITRYHIPEDGILHSHRRENLRWHLRWPLGWAPQLRGQIPNRKKKKEWGGGGEGVSLSLDVKATLGCHFHRTISLFMLTMVENMGPQTAEQKWSSKWPGRSGQRPWSKQRTQRLPYIWGADVNPHGAEPPKWKHKRRREGGM